MPIRVAQYCTLSTRRRAVYAHTRSTVPHGQQRVCGARGAWRTGGTGLKKKQSKTDGAKTVYGAQTGGEGGLEGAGGHVFESGRDLAPDAVELHLCPANRHRAGLLC
eukprot:264949-Rhodomonas_salina.1